MSSRPRRGRKGCLHVDVIERIDGRRFGIVLLGPNHTVVDRLLLLLERGISERACREHLRLAMFARCLHSPRPPDASSRRPRPRRSRRGGGRRSLLGDPAMRKPPSIGSSWTRYVGLSDIAVQAARAREMAKVGFSAGRRRLRPMSSSDTKEPPLSRHPLQEGGAMIAKAQAGAGDQVLDRA
jgi:hypothetical protein